MKSPHALVLGSLAVVCITLIAAMPTGAQVATGPVLCVIPESADMALRGEGAPQHFVPAFIATTVPAGCPAGSILAYIPAPSRK